jgi:hypothetical protein
MEDLELDPSLAREEATRLTGRHPVIKAFVTKRSQSPHGQECTFLSNAAGPLDNLHHGTWRGLTWYDTDNAVVWLLGVGRHTTGDDSDVYDMLKSRHARKGLFPNEDDYLGLEPDADSFVECAAEQARLLVRKAYSNPGTEVRGEVADALDVGILVELFVVDNDQMSELWVAIAMPPTSDRALPLDYASAFMGLCFPDAEGDEVRWGDRFPHKVEGGSFEIVASYTLVGPHRYCVEED